MRTIAMTTLLTAVTAAADFPAPKDLPRQPELPNPLVMRNGLQVGTPKAWTDFRRPELKALFQHYMYGTVPHSDFKVEVLHTDAKAFGGKATLREVELHTKYGKFRVLVVFPNKREHPVACFAGPNFCGNHCLVDDPKVALPTTWFRKGGTGVVDNKATEAGRGKEKGTWNLEQSIDRGYAVATFYYGDVEHDRFDEPGQVRSRLPKEADTATIACWAWAVHRVVDYLTDHVPEVDAKRIAAVGHSRLGKTVLLATAFDDRIALAIPHQAGCGGTAPSRGKVGESVAQINKGFPHWFNANFKQFGDDPTRLPFDQHELVALCAPRPVLFSNAVEDRWANPDGQFEVLKAADPVYRFLGVDGLGSTKVPPLGKLLDSRLGYFIREGKHSMEIRDWEAFWAFADKHLKK